MDNEMSFEALYDLCCKISVEHYWSLEVSYTNGYYGARFTGGLTTFVQARIDKHYQTLSEALLGLLLAFYGVEAPEWLQRATEHFPDAPEVIVFDVHDAPSLGICSICGEPIQEAYGAIKMYDDSYHVACLIAPKEDNTWLWKQINIQSE